MRVISPYEVPQWTFEVAELCGNLADRMASQYRSHAELPPLVGLNMAHLALVQSFELLDFYYHRWSQEDEKVGHLVDSAQIREENGQRVMFTQKATLVMTMSAFEYAAKKSLELPRCPIVLTHSRVYLRGIMNESYRANLITMDDKTLWEFLSELRNCIVHNNAVADRTMELNLPHGRSLGLVTGLMTKSTPRTNTILLREAVLLYGRWCAAILAAIQKSRDG
jgi:hypothetical protein